MSWAIDDLSKSIELQPEMGVYAMRAAVYNLSGEYRLALADCDAAIAKTPDDASLFRLRAQTHRALGDKESAASDEKSAAAILEQER